MEAAIGCGAELFGIMPVLGVCFLLSHGREIVAGIGREEPRGTEGEEHVFSAGRHSVFEMIKD